MAKTIVTTIRLRPELREKLKAEAESMRPRVSCAALVESILEDWVEQRQGGNK